MQEFPVTAKGRLDTFLAQAAGITRVHAGQLIREGCVKVNGRVASKPAHIVEPENTVQASLDGERVSETHVDPVDLQLEVLYEDDACLVVAKPAGIAVHPAPGIKKGESTMLHGIAFLFAQRKIPFVASHVLVHRLDRETTGCLLVAKTPAVHLELQKQFQDRSVMKSYLALVSGVPKQATAMIDAPIGRSTIHRTKMSVHHVGNSREAKTTYRTLGTGSGAALLACDLHTGRTHQLRVHLTTIGHPILGDPTYNNRESGKKTEELEIHNLCLHAWKLTFHTPGSGKQVDVRAPLPSALRAACAAAAIDAPSD